MAKGRSFLTVIAAWFVVGLTGLFLGFCPAFLNWEVPIHAVLLSVVVLLEFSALGMIPEILRLECQRQLNACMPPSPVFSHKDYPMIWLVVREMDDWQGIFNDPQLAAASGQAILPEVRRFPARLMSTLCDRHPQARIIPMIPEVESQLTRAWLKMASDTQTHAEKALAAQASELQALAECEKLRNELSQVRQANHTLHAQLTALRSRQRAMKEGEPVATKNT